MGDLRDNDNITFNDREPRPARAQGLVDGLLAARHDVGVAAKAQEYVDEAEHQDGYGYWDQFNTLEEVIEDFDLYRQYP